MEALQPAKYVTVDLAAKVTGLTEKAIRRKMQDGVWIQNRQWRKGPDGRIYINLRGVEEWVEAAT